MNASLKTKTTEGDTQSEPLPQLVRDLLASPPRDGEGFHQWLFRVANPKTIASLFAEIGAWLSQQDWSAYKIDKSDNDEQQCLNHLLSALIRVERDGKAETISVDEIITRINTWENPEPERSALLRHGIKYDLESITVANKHQGLNRIFFDTPWGGEKWKAQLLRIEGAHSSKIPVRFGGNIQQRGVVVPL